MTSAPTPAVDLFVLEDPSGRRRRRMRLAGRAISLLFLVWFVAIALGGLGIAPGGRFPLGRLVAPPAGPPAFAALPVPRPPTAADLSPALPASYTAAPAGAKQLSPTAQRRPAPPARAPRTRAQGQAGTDLRHGRKTSPGATAARGRSTTAPGQVRKPDTRPKGRGGTAPTAVAPGRSTAPGQVRKADTRPRARSGSAPTPVARGRSTTPPAGQVRNADARPKVRSETAATTAATAPPGRSRSSAARPDRPRRP